MTALSFHSLATLFPLIEGEEFDELVADIREHGIRERIALLNGAILDGRNRYRALAWLVSTGEILGPGWGHREGLHLTEEELLPENVWFWTFCPDIDGDPVDFVISRNLKRRHLTPSQRSMLAADIEGFRHGGDRKSVDQDANLHLDREAAAKAAQVSERSVATAAHVRDHAVQDLAQSVRDGHVSVSAAAEVAQLPEERQRLIVDQLRGPDGKITAEAKKALAPVVKELRAEKQQEKRQARDQREQQLAEKILSAPTTLFGVILEDFEWDHKPYSRETGMDRHPSNHYPTAHDAHTPEEIVARTAERFKCAHPDSVLYMWATIPHLFIALQVMALRGYTYKTSRSWNKVRSGKARGPGYWVTGEHEILLIGTRGKFNAAPIQAHFRSNFDAPAGEHSEKPDQQYEHAEFHFPNLPKIELNARRARSGWTAWGFDAPEQDTSASPSISIAANDMTIEPAARNGSHRNSVVTENPEAKADVQAAHAEATASPGIEPSASRLADGRTSDVPALPLAGTPSPEPLPTVAGAANGEDGGVAELPAASPPIAGDAHGCTAHQSPAGDAASIAAASPLFSDDPKLVELGKLRTVNHGDRAEAAKYAAELIARGHAFELRPGDWGLTRSGLARAEELQAELGSPIATSQRHHQRRFL